MPEEDKKITVRSKGPYLLRGGIPLVRKSQVMSPLGERLSWKDEGTISAEEPIGYVGVVSLNRNPSPTVPTRWCGSTARNRPTRGQYPIAARPLGPRRYLSKKTIRSVCIQVFAATPFPISGACGATAATPKCWQKIIDKLDNCPSGSLAYALESGGEIIEPDLRRSGPLTLD